jgi:hypothetical protein
MICRISTLYTAAGSLALTVGLTLRLWTHGNYSHFATGFLLGISIAFFVFGAGRRSRGASS